MELYCNKCLTKSTEWTYELGKPCPNPNCDGVVEREPTFAELTNKLPEEFYCPRRSEGPHFFAGPDHWDQFKSNGDRVCSYCGSLHPEDMFRLMKESGDAPDDAQYLSVPEIEPSDKSYKIYVHRKSVRNAHEGGIKFYTSHLLTPDGGTLAIDERNAEFSKAVNASRNRFNKWIGEQEPSRS